MYLDANDVTAKLFFLFITWNVIYVTSIKNGTIPRDPSKVSRISMSDTTPNWNLQPKFKKMLHGSWNIQTVIMPFKTPGSETTYNRNYYLLCHLVFFKIIKTIFASKIEKLNLFDSKAKNLSRNQKSIIAITPPQSGENSRSWGRESGWEGHNGQNVVRVN